MTAGLDDSQHRLSTPGGRRCYSLASMPELPEVEINRRNLERWLKGRKVVRAEAERTRTFRGSDPKRFEALRGRLLRARRRGKYLLLELEGGQGLLMHLGMTGKLLKRPAGMKEAHSRARFFLDNGEVIHFSDTRLFGRLQPLPAGELEQTPPLSELGRDPLNQGLTPAQLEAAIGGSRQEIKVALMDQSRIAGLGNLHAAEALFRAGIHPARKPGSLSPGEWKRLAAAIHQAIDFALSQQQQEEPEYVEELGVARNPFLVYGRAGEPCRKCGAKVKSFTQAGRTTHYCPRCQPKRGSR